MYSIALLVKEICHAASGTILGLSPLSLSPYRLTAVSRPRRRLSFQNLGASNDAKDQEPRK
jgi:hypothetical protein